MQHEEIISGTYNTC